MTKTVKITSLDEFEVIKGKTQKTEVDAITDLEIKKSALADPDSQIPTARDLEGFSKPKTR